MNWDRIGGNWKQMTGKLREKWGKLTDSEIEQMAGNRDQLVGKGWSQASIRSSCSVRARAFQIPALASAVRLGRGRAS